MKEVNQWLEFSMDDLDSAEIMFKNCKYNMVCFFAHQKFSLIVKV
ncbi:HEPN domain-containing protein [Thermoanaerobacterium thermosaccharolyticum]|jgi:HEPN domain-containing protein|nr:HEPN domain-containing protein [Thermoanaerobacterium thermosaccharolyticum]TCW42570.1 HEPN domain-containing protein [Thermohydrogenium kirishiense]